MNISASNTQNLDSFIEGLIEQKHFTELSSDIKEELKKDILVRLNDFIMSRVIASFSDDAVEKFEQLLKENKSEKELQQFTLDNIADYETFLTAVLLEFQDVYLGKSLQQAN